MCMTVKEMNEAMGADSRVEKNQGGSRGQHHNFKFKGYGVS